MPKERVCEMRELVTHTECAEERRRGLEHKCYRKRIPSATRVKSNRLCPHCECISGESALLTPRHALRIARHIAAHGACVCHSTGAVAGGVRHTARGSNYRMAERDLPEQRVEECAHGRHNKTCVQSQERVRRRLDHASATAAHRHEEPAQHVRRAGIRGSPTAEEGLAHGIRLIGTGSSRGYSTPQQAARKAKPYGTVNRTLRQRPRISNDW